ncbi:MAG: hypothetical protein GC164_13325 [Phycisphaera sp.]|nr:hypothetical protein [Phycisphaera sp.]
MAKGRISSGAGLAVALVIVSFGFVLSLLFAIIFYNQSKDAQANVEEAQKKLAVFIRDSDRTDPQVSAFTEQAQKENISVVRAIINEMQSYARLVSPDPLNAESLQQRLISAGFQTQANPAPILSVLNVQRQTITEQTDEIARLKGELTQVNSQLDAARSEVSGIQQTYQNSQTQNLTKIDQLSTEFQAYQGKADSSAKSLEQRLQEVQAKAGTDIADLQTRIDQLVSEKAELQRKIDDLTNPGGDSSATIIDTSLIPDGKILNVSGNTQMVFIDLGAKDHVLLGMTFEVYDRATGIVRDEFGDLRGKATIEITRIEENSSLCRVVRKSRNAVIVEGDVIGNVVYDRNATLKFHIFGDFDLDNTGAPTLRDRDRVVAMVTDWGGQVMDKLSYDTDFLVLGKEPTQPDALSKDEIDPVKIAEHEAAQRRFDQYQQLINEARRLKIPILNQNRFLSMVGYYQR